MYIESTQTYYHYTEQRVGRAMFLILIQSDERKIGPDNLKAIVRKVALRQLGQFMMGSAQIGNIRYTISGSYGSDGLPLTVEEKTFQRYGIPVPRELYDAWNKGGGWNGAGNEATQMRQWALRHLDELCP